MTDITHRGSDGCPLYAVSIGAGPTVFLLHGGGPDHRSLVSLAGLLADRYRVVLPDVRGYGRSVCADPALHTWSRYADDVVALMDHLGLAGAAVGGTGMGGTIALRAAAAHSERVQAALVISLEDIEDDAGKQAEAEMLERFAARVRSSGLGAAWSDLLPSLAPVIGNLVREAIPRADPASIVAACAIGRDRAFRTVDDLKAITVPTLIVPGADARHPGELAALAVQALPQGELAPAAPFDTVETAEELGHALAPALRAFLESRIPA
ncbi:alpha/beta fold hydrolase [Streptomyces lincolnensis]|nr:alpha/beta fold hydrolase [Streptomyces lincolnensis]QMV11235.1 alpha/beta fold hydrolase [Streptomyces lincolnensis]